MIGLDLEFLQRDNPLVLKEPNRFDEVRYSDLHYAGRLQALLSATRDNGMPLACAEFNDFLNGRHSLASVNQHLINLSAK